MRWEDFRPIDFYEDRLPPGADRSLPGTYPDVKPTKSRGTPRLLTMPQVPPLIEAENRRQNQDYIAQRSRLYGQSSPDQPQYVGLPNTQSPEIGYLGVMQDYPDRMQQRDPNVRRYDDQTASVAPSSTMVRFLGPPAQLQPRMLDEHAPMEDENQYSRMPDLRVEGNRSRMPEVDPMPVRPWGDERQQQLQMLRMLYQQQGGY